MSLINICNRIIEYSFYALFFFIPLVFFGDTSELFEFNKLWLTFVIAIIIAAFWGIKSIFHRKFSIQKTPLDLPILLFLLSQVISTIFSIDPHTSIWGFYSRFNGGLLSIFAYIFLYYAFVSNTTKEVAKRALFVSLAAGFTVVLWGLPSHFGYDPTCYLFKQSFDVSCWTESFQPKIRIFSTLGQPNWLAAYLAILIPISIALGLKNLKFQNVNPKQYQSPNDQKSKRLEFENWNLFGGWNLKIGAFILIATLFYIALLYTGSRSGFIGLLAGAVIFFILKNQKTTFLKFAILPLLIASLLVGTPIDQQIKSYASKFIPKISSTSQKIQVQPKGPALETGGTESGTIRLIVWRGAIDTWLNNPIFGTGVETFAYAYYKYRPVAHNLTSEWDYLYNKAHNEYLNYLATTGAFGLGSYLAMIGTFLFVTLRNRKQISNTNLQDSKHLEFENWNLFGGWNLKIGILKLALLASYTSILVSNFLGFSVVIINLYFFLIPALVFVLEDMIDQKHELRIMNYESGKKNASSILQWILIAVIILTSLFIILTLYLFWDADKSYARGYNLNRAGQYQYAYLDLIDAVQKRPDEPTFLDELSYNTAILAAALGAEESKSEFKKEDQAKISSYAAKLARETLRISDKLVSDHPNNIVFWKTRIRVLNLLAQTDKNYTPLALDAAKKAILLAPTDARLFYSLGILYGQNNQKDKAIQTLQYTISLKSNYRDAYYALALFYHDISTDKNSHIINPEMQEKAEKTVQYILNHIASDDAQAKSALETWKP